MNKKIFVLASLMSVSGFVSKCSEVKKLILEFPVDSPAEINVAYLYTLNNGLSYVVIEGFNKSHPNDLEYCHSLHRYNGRWEKLKSTSQSFSLFKRVEKIYNNKPNTETSRTLVVRYLTEPQRLVVQLNNFSD